MKKIALFLSALAMLVACEKEEGGIQQNAKVTIGVNHEQVTDGVGRVAISENGNKFTLNWEGIEELLVTTSTNNAYTSPGSGFDMSSHDGVSAKFTGELPNAGADVTVTDYFAAVSSFMSRSFDSENPTTRNFIRLKIANEQTYNTASISNACILLGEQADCEVGVIPGDFELKTMNAFIKIPVTRGNTPAGSTNKYVNGMKLQSVKIEAIGGEQLSGVFGFDLNAEDWSIAYGNDTNIKDSNKASYITLTCNDLTLSNLETDLYVAVAFGTYTQGLKVTFTVLGDDDKVGEMVRTFGASGIEIARNTLLSMPPIAISPKDKSMEGVSTYTMLTTVESLQAGQDYFMGGQSKNGLCLLTGGVSSGHAYTSDYKYDETHHTLTTEAQYKARAIQLEAVNGVNNAYRISYKNGSDTLYLVATDAKSGKLATVKSNDSKAAYYWVLTNATNGIKAIQGGEGAPEAQLLISQSANSNYIRSGATSTTGNPLQFFKEN